MVTHTDYPNNLYLFFLPTLYSINTSCPIPIFFFFFVIPTLYYIPALYSISNSHYRNPYQYYQARNKDFQKFQWRKHLLFVPCTVIFPWLYRMTRCFGSQNRTPHAIPNFNELIRCIHVSSMSLLQSLWAIQLQLFRCSVSHS